MRYTIGIVVLLAGSLATDAFAQEEAIASDDAPTNLITPTFGGQQFWTDEFIYGEWRIQRNVFTGHYRLLDDDDRRRAWGDYNQCRRQFEHLKQQLQLPPLEEKAVVVLHGLCRTRDSMQPLCDYLKEQGGYEVVNVSYASSRDSIGAHADVLADIVENLAGVREVNFVAHSLGNLVIRRYLAEQAESGAGLKRRIGRIVMLAPPNNGSQAAETFRDNPLFRTVWGDSGIQLAEKWDETEDKLATPPVPFGVIAGGRSDGEGYNPLIEGDDDLVVSVAETRLPGAADFLLLPVIHTRIMDDSRVMRATLQFLRRAYFVSADRRQPIRALEPATP